MFRLNIGLLSAFLFLYSSCLPRGSSQLNTAGGDTQFSGGVSDAVEMFRIILPNVPVDSDQVPNVEELLAPYAFDVLTESGKQIFLKAVRYQGIHKAIRKDNTKAYEFAKPLACALNVYQVMWVTPLDNLNKSANNNVESLENLENKIRSEGGIVVEIPAPAPAHSCSINVPYTCSKSEIEGFHNGTIKFFNEPHLYGLPEGFFDQGIPPGIMVLGRRKHTDDASSGHSAIVGDLDDNGAIMLYHNNWWRPENSTNGMRYAGMVSISNLYQGNAKPRQWMATRWLYFKRDPEHGNIQIIKSVTPAIDDLDPLNSAYDITLAIPASIIDDFKQKRFVSHKKSRHIKPEDNIHHSSKDREGLQDICRLNIDPTNSHPEALKNFFYEYAQKGSISAYLNQILEQTANAKEKLMELYVHQAGNPPAGYRKVTFYKAARKANKQEWFSLYLRNDAFSQNSHAFVNDNGNIQPTFDNKIYCTTKQKMEEENLTIYRQYLNPHS